MRRPAPTALLALLALTGACPLDCGDAMEVGAYPTDSGRWKFTTYGLQFDPCEVPGTRSSADGEALLAGTRWCPTVDCIDTQLCQARIDRDILGECYDFEVEGPGMPVDNCLEVLGTGAIEWRFLPRPCEQDGIFLPEQLTVHGADGPDIHGRLTSYLDNMGAQFLIPETGDSFPADFTQPADATHIKVAADQPVHLLIDLRLGERRVAWNESAASLEVVPITGAAPQVELGERSTVLVKAPTGSQAAVTLHVGDTSVELGRIIAVGLDEFVTLEPLVGYTAYPVEGSRMPTAARALVRDATGELVYGAPATWEVLAGAFPLVPITFYAEDANHDYTLLSQEDAEEGVLPWCFTTPRAGERSYTARLAASVGGLREEVELAWTIIIDSAEDPLATEFGDSRPNPNCQGPGFDEPGACACRSDRPSAPAALFVGLLALATIPRRRRAHTILLTTDPRGAQ